MTITTTIDLLSVLEEVADGELLDAMEEEGMQELEVNIEIVDFFPGRPAKAFGPVENCYPEEPAEWEQVPQDDYGQALIHQLGANDWTRRALRKGQLKPIAEAVNQAVANLAIEDEVWAHWRALQENAA